MGRRRVTPEESRAYREGVIDQKLEGHDRHFADINGSIDRIATAVGDIKQTMVSERAEDRIVVSALVDQVHGFAISLPAIQKMASDTASASEIAEAVAVALKAKDDDEKQDVEEKRSTYKRYREIAAWAVGIIIAVATITNLTTRLLGEPIKTPVKVKVVTTQR